MTQTTTKKPRWNWRRWQEQVLYAVHDVDARRLSDAWPHFARQQPSRKRALWAHEITYDVLPSWSMSRVMEAANRLEEAGLALRCPGLPLYLPTLPASEEIEALKGRRGS